jgi:hypothetical protein
MQPPRARLGIDYGTATTAAVLALPGGPVVPLLVDDAPAVPSGVFADPDDGHIIVGREAQHYALNRPDCYLPDPKQHITAGRIPVAGREVDVLDLIAATLRHLAREAVRVAGGPVAQATMTVPSDWGPRRRGLLREAAIRAGLAEPDLVADPVAAASALHAAIPAAPGACLVVVDAGAGSLHASVVQHGHSGWQVLATADAKGAGGRDVDDTIATHAGGVLAAADAAAWNRLQQPASLEDLRSRRALWEAARQAKHTLWYTPSTLIPLPAPHLPAVLNQQQFTALVAPLLERVTAVLDDVIAAADVDRSHLTAVLLTGGGAHLAGLAETITARTGLSPTVPERPDHVFAEGALHASAAGRPAPPQPQTGEAPRTQLRLRHAVAPTVLLAASLTVIAQTLVTADVYRQGLQPYVVTNSAGFSIAALSALLAALAAAHMVTTGGVVIDAAGTDPPPPVWAARLVAKSYTSAAAIGLTIAALYGMLAGAYYRMADNPFIRWSLLAALPVAIAAVATALLSTRLPADTRPRSLHRLRQPVIPVVLAAAGTLLMWASLTITPPASTLHLYGPVGRIGAATVGVAIALTVTRHRLLRTVVGTILAVGAAAVFTLTNATLIQLAYVAAVTWWWLVQLADTVRTAAPYTLPTIRDWLRGAGTPPSR